MTYDFAVLGDSQPEGLLVASGLVRKGFSVGLIPASSLGEMPGDEFFPTIYPAHAGGRKLDDLLFRAGFFRLEDSGLISDFSSWQFVFPKHRLTIEGPVDQWESEMRREFPVVADAFMRLFSNLKRQGVSRASLRRAASELSDLERRDPHFSRWLRASIESSLQPAKTNSEANFEARRALISWLEMVQSHNGKNYRVDTKLKTPYTHFLVEHARKWGVQVVSEPMDLKLGWSQFQITPSLRARHLILNSVGARRVFVRAHGKGLSEKMNAWLYMDRLECPLGLIPEPLKEFCILEGGRLLHLRRDVLRDEAHLSLGTWLPFDESKPWTAHIERGRYVLSKLIPFLPASSFRQIPSLLELTEMRGECIRRGQIERLQPAPVEESRARAFMRWIRPQHRETGLIARRVYSLSPHDLAFQNRMSSFEAALGLLDHFDERRKGLRPGSQF